MPLRVDIDRTTPGFIYACECGEHGIENRDGHLSCTECHSTIDYRFPCGVRISDISNLNDSQLKQLTRIDTAFFGWYFLPHFIRIENGIPLMHLKFYKIYDNRKVKRLGMVGPRNSAKTTLEVNVIGSKETLFQMVRFGAIVSEESSLAKLHISSMKMEFEDNPIIERHFGRIVPKRVFGGHGNTYKWQEGDFITTTGTRWFARGMDQRTRGGKYRNQRYEIIIVEDPESKNNTKTAESIQANQDWLSREILPALDERTGRAYFAANTVCVGCIAETVKHSKKWETVFERMEPDGDGSSYWYLRWPLEAIADLKDEYMERDDFETFETEFNNNPNPDITKELNADNLMYWMGRAIRDGAYSAINITHTGQKNWETGGLVYTEQDRQPKPVEFAIGADIASSEDKRSDFSVVNVTAQDIGTNLYVIENYRFKTKQINQIAQEIFDRIVKFNPQNCTIEENNVGKAVGQHVQELLHHHNRSADAKNKLRTNVIMVVNMENKQDRIKVGIQIPLNARRLFIVNDLHKDLKQEIIGFPKLIHDDCLDALEICISNSVPSPYRDTSEAMRGIAKKRNSLFNRRDKGKNRWLTL